MLAGADEIGSTHAPQCLAQHRPVVCVVPAQKRFVQAAHLQSFRNVDGLARVRHFAQRILARVPHRCRRRHRRGQKCLYLVRTIAVALEPERELEHVFVRCPRMGGDEVRNQILLLARFLRVFIEELLEPIVCADARLHHLRERTLADRFRRNLEIAADVMLHELLHVLGRFDCKVVAYARADQDLLDPGQCARTPIQLDERHMVRVQVRANARIHARGSAAGRFDRARLAGEPIHVRGGPAEIRNDAREARDCVAYRLDLFDDRFLGTVLNDATLVLGDRAERTAAETAALNRDRKADHLVRGDLRGAIHRVRYAPIRQLINRIHFLRRQRQRRRIEPHVDTAMSLNERTRVARIRFGMKDSRSMRVQHGILAHRLERRHANDRARAIGARDLTVEANDLCAALRSARRRVDS